MTRFSLLLAIAQLIGPIGSLGAGVLVGWLILRLDR